MVGCGHPCDCPTYREHLLSIGFAASAMPTRRAEASKVNAKEKRWEADMPAYRRLRKDGLQPQTIDGAARLEAHADTALEVQAGKLKSDVRDEAERRLAAAKKAA